MGKRVFVKKRLNFLQGLLPDYVLKKGEDRDAFVDQSISRFLRRFPVSLPMDTDPTEEALKQVNDDAPEFEEPLGAGDFAEETRKRNERRGKEEILATVSNVYVYCHKVTLLTHIY